MDQGVAMKFRFVLKDPDAFHDAAAAAAQEVVSGLALATAEEREFILDSRRALYLKAIGRWVEHDEYVTLEFDLAAGTAVVVERDK